jgi:hypothetical protein
LRDFVYDVFLEFDELYILGISIALPLIVDALLFRRCLSGRRILGIASGNLLGPRLFVNPGGRAFILIIIYIL